MNDRPRILLFTGEGKGKTTAALGTAFRAAGHGQTVCVVQFIKADAHTGELAAAARLENMEFFQAGLGFLPPRGDAPLAAHREAAEQGLQLAEAAIRSGRFAMIVLDEICLAVARGLLEEEQVLQVIHTASPSQCIILTGRYATPGLTAVADTVTEMRCVQHGFQQGRPAQQGVEF